MSKSNESQAGVIDLLDDPAVIAKKVKRAVTDTETEVRFDIEKKAGVSNLLTIHAALSGTSVADLEQRFAGRGYGDLKTEVADVLVEFTSAFRERTRQWLDDADALDDVLADGAARAQKVASETVAQVYDAVGFVRARG
jgi:tryptophanyl-tRNA synthetase